MFAMEGLRGLAILLVFLCHYYEIVWRTIPQPESLVRLGLILMRFGGTGVDLFFVLSGYLIYGAVRKPNLKVKRYLRRRAERIYPTFLAVLLIYLVISPFLSHGSAIPDPYASRIPPGFLPAAMYIGANLMFLPGVLHIQPIMNVAWSLSYEWFFYLSLPLAVAVTGLYNRTRWQRVGIIAAAGAFFVAAIYAFPERFYVPFTVERTCHVRAIMFLGGMLVYELTETKRIRGRLPAAVQYVAAAVVIVGCLIPAVLSLKTDGVPASPAAAIRLEVIEAVSLFLGYSLLAFVVLKMNGWKVLFEWTPLRWLGNMSYSFYLVHGLPLHVLGLLAARTRVSQFGASNTVWIFALGAAPAFVLTAACCVPFFVLVEKRLSLQPRSERRLAPVLLAESREDGVLVGNNS